MIKIIFFFEDTCAPMPDKSGYIQERVNDISVELCRSSGQCRGMHIMKCTNHQSHKCLPVLCESPTTSIVVSHTVVSGLSAIMSRGRDSKVGRHKTVQYTTPLQ